jgi:hypothetical protein
MGVPDPIAAAADTIVRMVAPAYLTRHVNVSVLSFWSVPCRWSCSFF